MILILHHIEAEYEEDFEPEYLDTIATYLKFVGDKLEAVIWTSQEGIPIRSQYLRSKLYKHAFRKLYLTVEDVTVSRFETWDFAPYDEAYFELPWGQGECPEGDCIQVSSHHRYTYLYPWMRELKQYSGQIVVGGGMKYECLLDLREALTHLEIDYRTEDILVYG